MELTKTQEELLNSRLKAEQVLEKIGYRTETIQNLGENIRCFCPIHKETIFRSLTVNIVNNSYRCGYTMCDGFRGGNLIELYSKAKGISYEDAIDFWMKQVGLGEAPSGKVKAGAVPGFVEEEFIESVRTAPPLKTEDIISQKLQELDSKPDDRDLRKELAELYVQINDIPNAVDHFTTLSYQGISAGQYQNVIPYLEKILQLDTTNNQAREMLAQASIQIGKREQAIQLWSITAKNYLDAKQPEKAIEIYGELVRQEPMETQWRSLLTDLLIKLERISEAVRELKLLADYYIQRGQLEDAYETYEKVLKLTPTDIDAKKRAISTAQRMKKPESVIQYGIDLVDSLLTSGNVSGAIETLHQSLGETPGNLVLRKKLVDVLLQSGATEEAVHQLGALAQLYIENNDLVSAADTYQHLSGLQPQNMNLCERLIELYEKLGKNKELIETYSRIAALHLSQRAIEPAITALKRAVEIDPSNTRAQNALASAYIREKSQTKATDVLISLAKKYQSEGDLDRARRSFDRILEFNPTAVAAHQGLIEIYHAQDKPRDMVKHYCEIAEVYRNRDEYSSALDYIRKGLRLQTSQPEPIALQAKIYSQMGSSFRATYCYYKLSKVLCSQERLADAMKAAQEALSLYPNVLKVRELLANLYIQMGLKGDAFSELRNLATYYEKSKQNDKAIQSLEQARDIDSSNLTILESLARLYVQQKSQDKAITIYLALAEAFYSKGLLDDCIESYQRVLSFDPNHQEAISNLATAYLDVGATTEAIQQYENLITIYRNQRVYGEAIELCKQILHMNSNNTDIHQTLVDIYLEVGEQKEAVTHLLLLADIYRKQGGVNKAIEVYRRLQSSSPETYTSYHALAEIYVEQGNKEEAFKLYKESVKYMQKKGLEEDLSTIYRKLVEMQPHNLELREKLADQYHKIGQTMESLMEYDAIGGLYMEEKKYDKVVETYKKMKLVDPSNEDIDRAITQAQEIAKKKSSSK